MRLMDYVFIFIVAAADWAQGRDDLDAAQCQALGRFFASLR